MRSWFERGFWETRLLFFQMYQQQQQGNNMQIISPQWPAFAAAPQVVYASSPVYGGQPAAGPGSGTDPFAQPMVYSKFYIFLELFVSRLHLKFCFSISAVLPVLKCDKCTMGLSVARRLFERWSGRCSSCARR